MPSRGRTGVSVGVIDEHAAILRAVQSLENALAYPTAKRLTTWRHRLLRDLTPVSVSLREHCESTERTGGTLADFEIVIGRTYQLTAVRREHKQLMAQADDVLASIECVRDAAYAPPNARTLAAQLTVALRRHCLSECDLIQLRFNLDLGVVD